MGAAGGEERAVSGGEGGLRVVPRHHADLLDCLLVVQAIVECATLVTHDLALPQGIATLQIWWPSIMRVWRPGSMLTGCSGQRRAWLARRAQA
jgi:hypothetical protein